MRLTGYILLSVAAALYAGIVIGMGLLQMQEATRYSEGYCAALNGVRLSDEACNVSGSVVPVIVVEVK